MCEIAWAILGGFSFANTFHGKEGKKKKLACWILFFHSIGGFVFCFLVVLGSG